MATEIAIVDRCESVTLSDKRWDKLHRLARDHNCVVGPRNRPSWRLLLKAIADGKITLTCNTP